MSFWMPSISFKFCIALKSFVSSAKILMYNLTSLGRSFMNIINSIGPRTLPWGIPDITSAKSDMSLRITLCCLLLNKFMIHVNTAPCIPCPLFYLLVFYGGLCQMLLRNPCKLCPTVSLDHKCYSKWLLLPIIALCKIFYF